MVHTVPALAEFFDREARQEVPGLDVVHVVNPTLLRARVSGAPDVEVREQLLGDVQHLLTTTSHVLVTCSSLGGLADEIASQTGHDVSRIDRPMAYEAARLAQDDGRVVILATLNSTLAPTSDLVRRAVAPGVEIRATLVEGAADSQGRQELHDELIREAVEAAQADDTVVVLAQASMARAVSHLDTDRVLTSPASGLAAFLNDAHGGASV